jgi:hypothetical protein
MPHGQASAAHNAQQVCLAQQLRLITMKRSHPNATLLGRYEESEVFHITLITSHSLAARVQATAETRCQARADQAQGMPRTQASLPPHLPSHNSHLRPAGHFRIASTALKKRYKSTLGRTTMNSTTQRCEMYGLQRKKSSVSLLRGSVCGT